MLRDTSKSQAVNWQAPTAAGRIGIASEVNLCSIHMIQEKVILHYSSLPLNRAAQIGCN